MNYSLKNIANKLMFLSNIFFIISIFFIDVLFLYAALITWLISLILKVKEEKHKGLIALYIALILLIIAAIVFYSFNLVNLIFFER